MNMKSFGRRNIRKHSEIKGSEKYVTLDISLKFDSLEKMIITSSETKYNLVISEKGLNTSIGLKAKASPKKYKQAMYFIGNFSKNDPSKIIKEFDKLHYESYERRRSKHEPKDCYSYL